MAFSIANAMAGNVLRTIKVFIASPGDLAVERRAFKETIDELNKLFGRGASVFFEPLGWADALAQVGRRSQSVINQDIDACEVFILAMWRRWGQEAPDAAPYTSYTEEEFYRALARRETKDAKGMRRPAVCVFFKHIDPQFLADPGDQLKKVLAFRRKLEDTKKALYRPFADEAAFRREITEHLIAFAQGRYEGQDDASGTPLVPESVTAELEKHKAEKQQAVAELEKLKAEKQLALEEAERARAQAKDATERANAAEALAEAKATNRAVELAESAARAALEGKIEQARQDFARALDGTTNLHVLNLGSEFFHRVGELDEAERLVRRWLSISGPDQESTNTAAAYGNLGVIEQTRGNLDVAEGYHKKALASYKTLDNRAGIAITYGNLGVCEQKRGNLDAAEGYITKALEIDDKLGNQKGVAHHNGSLGVIADQRGNKTEARPLWVLSRDIFRKIGARPNEKQVQGWLDGLG